MGPNPNRPWEATEEELARGASQREFVKRFIKGILPEGGIQYGKYSNPTVPAMPNQPVVDVYNTKNRLDAQELPSAPVIPVDKFPRMSPVATYRDDINAGTSTAIRPEGTATIRFNTGATSVGGPMAGARTGQIWAGATTDAEAARNLQARALQDQATQEEIARMDRTTEALRSLREARSPPFRFGVDSIGGGPSRLDVASGRAITRDTPASVVADRMISAVNTARRFGAGGKAGRSAAELIANAYLADKQLQGTEAQLAAKEAQLAAKQGTGINPIDMGRFLLDQQKFAQQQGIDRFNLQLREKELQNKEAGTSLEQQKYLDTQRKAFIDNFTFSDPNAPRDQIGIDIFEMSRVSGIPPETITAVYEQVVKELGIDWEKGGPKSQKALSEEVMKRLTRDYRG